MATAAAVVLGLWVVAGQAATHLPSFASGAVQIINGYSAAMGLDIDPGLDLDLPCLRGDRGSVRLDRLLTERGLAAPVRRSVWS